MNKKQSILAIKIYMHAKPPEITRSHLSVENKYVKIIHNQKFIPQVKIMNVII